MALTSLRFNDTRVRDLAPLRAMPLKTVALPPLMLKRVELQQLGEAEIIRSWTQLETINDVPPRALLGRLPPRAPK